jgi:hypothetical protein
MTTQAPKAHIDPCPEPEQLAAYVDFRLPPAERTDIDQHLVSCADCREVVTDTIASLPSEPVRRRPLVKWTAAGGALVAAAASVVLLMRTPDSPMHVPEMASLLTVSGAARPIEARLSWFPYAPAPVITRGPAEAGHLELAARANQIREKLAARTGDSVSAARGVLDLIAGRPDDAVKSLESATSGAGTSAAMWNDLAAAYLTRGRSGDFERAAAAAERATNLEPTQLEAWFNRALALEALGRRADAAAAWNAYLAHDGGSAWAAEAREHLAVVTR